MGSKKSKMITYILSFLLPILIFLICTIINDMLPLGKYHLNVIDGSSQYPGIILELFKNTKNGFSFYSWHGSLGFNLYGLFTYYGSGILNILNIFANPQNYGYVSVCLILLRFGLLGLSMCFYLNKKNLKPLYIIILSISYSLMGFTSCYYYHYMWMDSIIMLPLIIYGLENIIEKNNPVVYIIFLTLAIFSNFYIGYMICLFCLLMFIYYIFTSNNKIEKKEILKTFIISSLLCVGICTIILLPSYYALMTGKNVVYQHTTYFALDERFKSILYSFTPANFRHGDFISGHALIYVGLYAFVNAILYFFNKNIRRKEKICSTILVLFFTLSILFKGLDYMWHLFAEPIFYQFRFSFLISFFVIYLAMQNIKNIDGIKLKVKSKILLVAILIILIELSTLYKLKFNLNVNGQDNKFLWIPIILSWFWISFYIILKNQSTKKYLSFIFITFLIDISGNTFFTLYQNKINSHEYNKELVKDISVAVNQVKDKDSSFYRVHSQNTFTENDGMYYSFNEVNLFSSIRNNSVNKFLVNIGFYHDSDYAHLRLFLLNSPILSMLNIKYIIDNDYKIQENEYPLSLGYTVSDKIKNLKLKDIEDDTTYAYNLNSIYNTFLQEEVNMYEIIDFDKFTTTKRVNSNKDDKETFHSEYEFKSKVNGSVKLSSVIPFTIRINDKKLNNDKLVYDIKTGDKIDVVYTYEKNEDFKSNNVNLVILDNQKYESAMSKLEENSILENIKTNKKGHILEAQIDVTSEDRYLFTSIPYEEGMKVYIDGNIVKPDKVFDSLIGFELPKGKHDIVIDYIPKGFVIGAIVSGISLIITGLYLTSNKKKLKENSKKIQDKNKWNIIDKVIAKFRYNQVDKYVFYNNVIVDIGCGQRGDFLLRHKAKIKKGYGFDFKIKDSEIDNLTFINNNQLDKLPLNRNSVDAVFLNAVLEHLENPESILLNALYVIKLGGAISYDNSNANF